MPTKPATPCGVPGCPSRATYRGKCAEHARLAEQQRGSPSARGYGREWKGKRDEYLANHPFCVDCLAEGKRVRATEVDHVVPLRQGGLDEPSNYAGRCKSHHSQKTARQSSGWG